MKKLIVIALAAGLVAGCDEGTGPGGNPSVAVAFATTGPTSSLMAFGAPIARSVNVEGTNGTLSLDTVHVILNEFELERVDEVAGCDTTGMEDDACEEFEAGPTLLSLPLDSGATTAVSAEIPVGEYDELEFEIEDLEDDEEDAAEAQQIDSLRTEIEAVFPDWPRQASMRIVGTFTPTGGDPAPFVVYAEAEIEVELEFATPFVVTEDDVSRMITVELKPSDWFTRGDGTVMDLTEFDYEATGLVPEFEMEMEQGIEGVEHDDED